LKYKQSIGNNIFEGKIIGVTNTEMGTTESTEEKELTTI
jgi:hypothetical protein